MELLHNFDVGNWYQNVAFYALLFLLGQIIFVLYKTTENKDAAEG